MKKLMIAVFAIFLAAPLFAQSKASFTLGPKAALNFSALSGNDSQFSSDRFVGYTGGLFARATFGRVYLQPEGYFSSKGGNIRIDHDPSSPAGGETSGKVRLTSLDVPLLLGYKLIDTKVFNFRIMGGPVASFLLQENRNDLKVLDANSYTYNKSNIGFQVGAGFDIGNVTFDARYEAGLNQINKTFNQRANLFQVGVGFKIF